LLGQKERRRLAVDAEIQREFQRSQRLALGMNPGRTAKRQGSKKWRRCMVELSGLWRQERQQRPLLAGLEQFPGTARGCRLNASTRSTF
jgi:hypothetical protein